MQRPEPGVVGPRQSVQKVAKVAKAKGNASGRTYTSKYRGVHQTFPTKRWEAQFRCGIFYLYRSVLLADYEVFAPVRMWKSAL